MGVDAKAVLIYGVYFKDKQTVKEFLSKYDVEELEEMDNDAELTCLNLYSGDPFVLGYEVDPYEPISYYEELWKKDFPDSEFTPEVHLEVQWW